MRYDPVHRKVWFAYYEADDDVTKETEGHYGRATVSAIDIGTGDATEYSAFNAQINFDTIPTSTLAEV